MKRSECPHYKAPEAKPRAQECQECGARNSLRICTSCGHVGCCESQQGHNTKHARAAGHPIIRELSGPAWEGFLWCYECNDYLE